MEDGSLVQAGQPGRPVRDDGERQRQRNAATATVTVTTDSVSMASDAATTGTTM